MALNPFCTIALKTSYLCLCVYFIPCPRYTHTQLCQSKQGYLGMFLSWVCFLYFLFVSKHLRGLQQHLSPPFHSVAYIPFPGPLAHEFLPLNLVVCAVSVLLLIVYIILKNAPLKMFFSSFTRMALKILHTLGHAPNLDSKNWQHS